MLKQALAICMQMLEYMLPNIEKFNVEKRVLTIVDYKFTAEADSDVFD